MDNQLETTDPQPKRRGFFDRPASFDFYKNAGGRFFGGLLVGLGFGLFMGFSLIKDELIPLKSMFWVISWLVLVFIGSVIAQRSVNRRAAPGTERSETS
jgi:hypothetical protein